MQTIRRYGNRKFYHVEGHRYVNLRDIGTLIREGEQVRVVEHPAGREITAAVLAQIIGQAEPAGLEAVLSSLIRLGRYPLEEAGRLILAGLGLPTRSQWQRLLGRVDRLEALLQRLIDEAESQML